jgi:formate hydrogenlyase subunit 6/NADH:ubiquinone oxidoreductase subunit I
MAKIPGVGLVRGLSVTLRHMLRKSITQQYPEVKPDLPPRSRGVIALVEENCTSCMLCARECPDWCIYIDSHKETLPAPEGGRPRQRNVLDRFAIDFALCMYCGICIEVCPFDALFWSPEFEYAEGDIRELLHEKEQLASWAATVPPPPAHDPGAEPPKELTAAPRRPAARGEARPARQASAPQPETGSGQDVPAGPKGGQDATAGSEGGRDAAAGSEGGQGAPAGPEEGSRPRRSVANVRGIRPPGRLPESAAGRTPKTPGPPPDSPEARTSDRPHGKSTDSPEESREPGRKLSTGEPPAQELSTDPGEPPSPAESEEQTSPATPRRRRMADPRSIRPPGRLRPDETRESEEDS